MSRQDQACYDWEREFFPAEAPPKTFPKGAPFPKDFLDFYQEAWEWALKRFRPNRKKPWPLPPLMLSRRMTKTFGRIDFGGESGRVPGILLARHGVRRCVLLHEMAHLLSPIGGHHEPIFCRISLDLYVQFLGVDEHQALALAAQYGVDVATPVDVAEWRAAKEVGLTENPEVLS